MAYLIIIFLTISFEPGHSTKEITDCKSVTKKVEMKNKTLILETLL